MNKKILSVIVVAFAIAIVMSLGALTETNDQGEFQVKQAWLTGEMSVRTAPGLYIQCGDIKTYKNVATIGFGRESGEGSANIEGIPVVFNDGSHADISGLVRVKLPAQDGIKLQDEYSGGYDHFVNSGILPVVRNAVKLSANLRSAQDAYTTLAVFQQAVSDQMQYGTYKTKSVRREFTSPTGDKQVKQVTEIVVDEDGIAIREPNRILELGCVVLECVIDVPDFDPEVIASISKRKAEAMKTELSKQSALRARQDAITSEEQGKANVAKAKYEEEVKKQRAVTKAQEKLEVQELATKEAASKAKETILAANAKKQELLLADGLSDRDKYQIDANKEVGIKTAEYMSKWVGPKVVQISGKEGSGGNSMMDALTIKSMLDIVDHMDKK